jgi:perosamine synthetase
LQVFKLFLYVVALNILLRPTFFWIPKGLPFLKLGETIFDPDFQMKKISSFQVGLTKSWVEKLLFFRQVRQDNIKRWLPALDVMSCKICLPNQPETPDLIRLPVRIEDEQYRTELLAVGTRVGAGISTVYPEALSEVPELNEMFKSENFPAAKKNARELITFPVHPFASHRDVDRIGAMLKNIFVSMSDKTGDMNKPS